MTWNPLHTLAGRMVLVTIAAVLLSYAAAFAVLANERGAVLRRAAETGVAERIAFTAERLRDAPHDDRAQIVGAIRDFGIRYQLADTPLVERQTAGGVAARIARLISQDVAGVEVRAESRTVIGPSRRWRAYRDGEDAYRDPPPGERPEEMGPMRRRLGDRDDPPTVRNTEVSISIALEQGEWLNARARLPGPRPAPASLFFAGLFTVLAVGIGAAMISRQIGRPLAQLAGAARALGAGDANVSAPLNGPEDVRRAAEAFNAMAERLGRQLNRQRQMLWALSHDLRTPITALKLRAELIEDEATRQRILAPVSEMEKLTEQALALARAGASEEERQRVDLAEIARTLCGELEDMGVPASAEAPAPVMLDCRPSEIARALRNLAENAAKYGGGGIMRVYRDGADVVAEVIDQGPGVPDDIRARLAEPFFRADAARSEAQGAGLGLAIAQAIADGHGGRLVLENRKPKGFSAKLILPGAA